jgi:hypothetical protein
MSTHVCEEHAPGVHCGHAEFEGVHVAAFEIAGRIRVQAWGGAFGKRDGADAYREHFDRALLEPVWSDPKIGPAETLRRYAGGIAVQCARFPERMKAAAQRYA